MARQAVFLDRDGTLMEEAGYLDDLRRAHIFPFTVDAVRQLNRAGLAVVVLTNQSGVARGIITEAFVNDTHRFLSDRLERGGAVVDRYYYCPHHPEATVQAYRAACECRKPKAGLWQRAARELGLDLAVSFSVGDRRVDVEAARAAGTTAVMVRTGYGRGQEQDGGAPASADTVVDNLAAAVAWILRRTAQ